MFLTQISNTLRENGLFCDPGSIDDLQLKQDAINLGRGAASAKLFISSIIRYADQYNQDALRLLHLPLYILVGMHATDLTGDAIKGLLFLNQLNAINDLELMVCLFGIRYQHIEREDLMSFCYFMHLIGIPFKPDYQLSDQYELISKVINETCDDSEAFSVKGSQAAQKNVVHNISSPSLSDRFKGRTHILGDLSAKFERLKGIFENNKPHTIIEMIAENKCPIALSTLMKSAEFKAHFERSICQVNTTWNIWLFNTIHMQKLYNFKVQCERVMESSKENQDWMSYLKL